MRAWGGARRQESHLIVASATACCGNGVGNIEPCANDADMCIIAVLAARVKVTGRNPEHNNPMRN